MARTIDQMLANEKPEVVTNARKAAEKMLLDIHLAELRERVQMTQGEMVKILGIKQPTVAELEKQGCDLSCPP